MFLTSSRSLNLKFCVFVEEKILKFENGDLTNMLKILAIFDITLEHDKGKKNKLLFFIKSPIASRDGHVSRILRGSRESRVITRECE